MLTDFNNLALSLYARFVTGCEALLKREEGQALVEYTLILALVSIVAIAALTSLGTAITNDLKSVTEAL